MPRVVVVGAGISGLALAFRLSHVAPSAELIVLEQRDRAGGTIWTDRRDGFQVELGANGFLDTKQSTLNLCRNLGLDNRLIAASEVAGRNRYLFLDARLRALPSSLGSFLQSDILSWRGKISVLAERLRPRRRDEADESIDAFVRRRLGREAADVLADALVTGIHAGDPELLSVRAAFPRLVALEKTYGSLIKGLGESARQRRAAAKAGGEPPPNSGRMWSFREGLRLLIEQLTGRLSSPIVHAAAVRGIEKAVPGWIVRGEGQDHWLADAVVLTCPAYEQAAIVADLDRELAEAIAGIPYNRVAVVALGYRRTDVPGSADGFGFIAPQRTRRDLLGVQWCSSIFPGRAPEGFVLMRAMCGGWNRPDIVDWDDAHLLQAVRAELRLAMQIEAPPVFDSIIRWERAIPQYHLGHLERLGRIAGRTALHPGLFLGGNAYHGVSLNDCTEQAEILAGAVANYLRP